MDKAKAIEILENELISLRYDGNISDELNDAYETAIKSLKESKTMERNDVISLAKELNITPEELGITPKVVTEKDEQLFHEVGEFIRENELEEVARDSINEKYWEDLGIKPEKKYKVVEVRVEKRIYNNLKVAIPIDEEEYNVDAYYDTYDLDADMPDDEDDWEVNDTSIYDSNNGDGLTKAELDRRYGDDLYNRYDLED